VTQLFIFRVIQVTDKDVSKYRRTRRRLLCDLSSEDLVARVGKQTQLAGLLDQSVSHLAIGAALNVAATDSAIKKAAFAAFKDLHSSRGLTP